MPLAVNKEVAEANSRLALIKLSVCTLRLMDTWRRGLAGFDEAMILLAIIAISSERLTRADLEEDLRSLATPIPSSRLAKTNLSSIASATGFNRETARRKVGRLIKKGLVVRNLDGTLRMAPQTIDLLRVHDMAVEQLEHLRRAANQLIRDNILEYRP